MRMSVGYLLVGLGALVVVAGGASAATLLFPEGGEFLRGTQTVTWQRINGGSDVELRLYAAGTEIRPELCDNCPGSSFSLNTANFADGTEYLLEVRESGNNINGSPRDTTDGPFTIDNHAPSTEAVLRGAAGAGGYYLGDVTVELIASDPTAGVASTSVSVDGGAAAAYGGSFRVTGDGAHTVRFQSTDRAGNVEAQRTVTFTIDRTAPDTGSAIAGTLGANGWFTGPVTTTLTPTDATSGVATTLASVDGAAWAAPGSTIVLAADGAHTIRFYSVDAAGNAEAVDSVAFRIDATAPATTADFGGHEGTNGWYGTEVLVTLLAADATSGVASTVASVDGGAAQAYTGALRFTTDGEHTIAFHSTDAAGNAEPARTVAFRIDTTAPDTGSAIAGTLGANGWFTGPVTTTLTPTDATSGVATTLASVDAAAWAALGNTIAIGTDGPHSIRFYSVDAAGNAEAVDSVAFRIDATAPETTRDIAGHAGTNGWYLEDVTFTLASTDATSGVAGTDFDLDDAGMAAYTGSVRVAGDGAHTIGYRATDRASNVEGTKTFTVRIDTVAPVSTIDVGQPSTDLGRVVYVTSATPIELGAGDATSGVARIEYRLNEGGFETYTGALFVLGEDGEYRLEWRAVDVAGNVEDAQFLRLFLDNTAPGMALDRPQPGGVYVDGVLVAETHPLRVETVGPNAGNRGVVVDTLDFAVATGGLDVTVTAIDAAVGTQEVRFLVDGVLRATDTEAPYAWTWDTSAETLGEHVLVVEAEDFLGNTADRELRVFTLPTAVEGVQATVDGVLAGTDPVLPKEVRDVLAQLPVASPEPPALPPLPVEPPALPPLPGEPPALPPLPAEPPVIPDLPPLPEPPMLPPVPEPEPPVLPDLPPLPL